MKNLFLTLLIALGTFTYASAIKPLFGPNGSLSMWNCSWDGPPSVSPNPDGTCHFERTQNCTHWLWATRTTDYSYDRSCNSNGIDDEDPPFNCPCGIEEEAHLIAGNMIDISASGISVPPQFMDATLLATDTQILEDCVNFRLALAGYDVNDPQFFDPCYLPSVTLPVQVPLYGALPISLECVSVSPNPATNYFNIGLNGLENQITSIQVIDVATGAIMFEEENPASPIVSVDVSNFENGSYNVLLFRNEEVSSALVQVID